MKYCPAYIASRPCSSGGWLELSTMVNQLVISAITLNVAIAGSLVLHRQLGLI
jgi:hypothetical protein